MNELLIKHDLSDLAEEKKEEDVVEACVEEETGFKADCVFTAENLEAALNLVMASSTSGWGGGRSVNVILLMGNKNIFMKSLKIKFDTCLCSFISKSQMR